MKPIECQYGAVWQKYPQNTGYGEAAQIHGYFFVPGPLRRLFIGTVTLGGVNI
jgi:hypothetical protein